MFLLISFIYLGWADRAEKHKNLIICFSVCLLKKRQKYSLLTRHKVEKCCSEEKADNHQNENAPI